MRDTFHDLETYSPVPIKSGSHAYAEGAEVMLWAFAGEDGEPMVWDLTSHSVWFCRNDQWGEQDDDGGMPAALLDMLDDPEAFIWFQNGGMFDFVVLMKDQPDLLDFVPMERWRDTMVLALLHSLPGALEKYGALLNFAEKDRKLADEGKRWIRLFCIPNKDGTRNTRATHPEEWKQFVIYAARDIITMREGRRQFPRWNDTEKQWALWRANLRMNYRGFAVDTALAEAIITTAEGAKRTMASRVHEITDGGVEAATQRDRLLAWILESHGVDLPDMRSDTLERRIEDPDLPPEVKELLHLRLRASMNSPAKAKALLKAKSSDGRLRGTTQFRGASRTGRDAHRLFQPGNLMRPTMVWPMIQGCVQAIKGGYLDLVWDNAMEACSNAIRSLIVAAPGKKLVVADLSNIEGRVAAWLAGETVKLDAFRAFDDGTGPDLYVLAYARSFNCDPQVVTDDKENGTGMLRQIGKVQELMFAYGGGVGAWITGAATYGIDLEAMTAAAYDTLPDWAVAESVSYLQKLHDDCEARLRARVKAWVKKHGEVEPDAATMAAFAAEFEVDWLKARYGLSEKVFVCCDSIKRMWRAANPRISSYWRELEDTIRVAINNPGQTFRARKVRIRRSGSWLRIGLPSGRELCYPNIKTTDSDKICYTGQNQYTRQWGVVFSYGGKFFENIVQAVANDQFAECVPIAEEAGYELVLPVHDEQVTECPDTDDFTAEELAEIMCSDLGWNAGLPLSAAGEEMYRYHKT